MENYLIYRDPDTNANRMARVLDKQTARGLTCYKIIDHEARAIIWIPETFVLRAPYSIYAE